MARRKTIFLIVYGHEARKQISPEEFRNTTQALKAYSGREEEYRDNRRAGSRPAGADSTEASRSHSLQLI